MVSDNIDDDDLFDKYVDGEGDMVRDHSQSNLGLGDSGDDSGDEDVVDSENDFDDARLSDVEGDGSAYPVYNPVESYDPTFELRMIFSSKTEFKKVVQSHAIKTKRNLKFTKNENRLWDYAEEVRTKNHGSTVILGTENENGEVRFSRFYVCFNALKQGFLWGCKPIIGVDGAHLKGVHGGVLLTAVGVDPNHNTYPIAYAIVRNECNET
ncbi:UNVERIFIED_CONTAM: hypothetical protein Scaly_0587700 [Sesamum calycinum]|uniref:MULE transposase domain-containing protein n=1 Tax=Sesamum calycinum TaxID=2727403 RepID=A0AAW2RSF4_9LAMI